MGKKKPQEPVTKEQAARQLVEIEHSFTRVYNQLEKSCIEKSMKVQMMEDVQDMASQVHHLVPIEEWLSNG